MYLFAKNPSLQSPAVTRKLFQGVSTSKQEDTEEQEAMPHALLSDTTSNMQVGYLGFGHLLINAIKLP